jgi:hypothetical protein
MLAARSPATKAPAPAAKTPAPAAKAAAPGRALLQAGASPTWAALAMGAVPGGVGKLAPFAAHALGRAVGSIGSPHDSDEGHAERVAAAWRPDALPGAWTTRPDGGTLTPAARQGFEAALGSRLPPLRIHDDARSHAAVATLGASAFTLGSDVYVGAGRLRAADVRSGRLLAHEIAHVAQDPHGTRIRRQLLRANATDAENDEAFVNLQQSQTSFLLLDEAREVGGLTGWRRRLPLSYPEMRRRSVAQYGEPTIAFLELHDATILGLVTKSHTVVERLMQLRAQVESDSPEDVAARTVIDYYIGTQDLWSDEPPGLYDVSYKYFALHLSQDSRFDLKLHEALLAGSVEDLVFNVSDAAGLAAQEAHALREQRAAWTAAATPLLGQKAAHRSGIFSNTAYHLAELRDPTWGSENWDDITAIARLGGHAAAVMRVGRRYYAFTLDEDFNRTDVFAASDWDAASLVLDDVVAGGRTVQVVTNDGFVLGLEQGAEVMFGGEQARRPEAHLEADARLAQASPEERHGIGAPQLFQSMVRNLALLNLQQSEQRLKQIVSSMQANGGMGFGVDPVRGAALQRASARLRELTRKADALAGEIGDKPPNPEQAARRDDVTSEMGQIVDAEPAAAFFVARQEVSTWHWVVAPGMAAIEKAFGEDVSDELAGMQGGDAASRAIEGARARLDNVAKVRRAMFDDPGIVLGFESLFDPVYAYFSESDKREIRISLAFRTLDEVAHSIRMAGVDVALLIAGFFTEGGTWAALGVEAAGVAWGTLQLQDQYARTQLTMAMAALDVPGGFQLASEEAAASAQHWFWIGVGLNFLGVVGMARTAGRLMQQSADEAALMGNLAKRAGVTEEVMAGAFRTSWRGTHIPDVDALREIMLARLPSALRQRYARIEIIVLDDTAWAARYPQNAAGNAAISFRVPRGGGVEAESIVFRAGGNPMAMQEEAEHILQASVGEQTGLVQDLVVAAQDWSHLSLEQRMEATASVLELEADAQERLLARAQADGDVVAMDDAFGEMQDINRRQVELDRAIGDPERTPPDWFDPKHPPDSLFGTPRMPRSRGAWSNPNKPGNCTWISTRKEVLSIVPDGKVEFVNGYPNFRPWSVGETRITQAGKASDFGDADLAFALQIKSGRTPPPAGYTRADFLGRSGDPIAAGTERFRQAEGLTWHHHQGGTVMLLVPTKLHANIPHTGGASAARAALP